LSITATGTAPITYQWYFNSNPVTGATNNTFLLNNLTTADAGTYYCIATNTCNTDQSDNIGVTVKEMPEITAQTTNSTRCAGQGMTFSVTATGSTPLTYQWYFGTTAISGATNNTYTINSVGISDAGTYYCKVTNSCGSVLSNNITLPS